jgi:uncharacterized membrane protein YdjX (TVP38/TMEM64 family)
MFNSRKNILYLILICLFFTALGIYILGGIDQENLQLWLNKAGIFAPLVYIFLYIIATILLLPSTPLNLSGGAIFGTVFGTIWTSLAALMAAIIAFYFTRTIGQEIVKEKFAGRWKAINSEITQGGIFYMFAIRLLPIIPYGLVNFTAGLTSISFKDYIIGTTLGTIPGILPFVMIGSSGITAIKTGDFLPLLFALFLTGMLVGVATWYRKSRQIKKSNNLKDQNNDIF